MSDKERPVPLSWTRHWVPNLVPESYCEVLCATSDKGRPVPLSWARRSKGLFPWRPLPCYSSWMPSRGDKLPSSWLHCWDGTTQHQQREEHGTHPLSGNLGQLMPDIYSCMNRTMENRHQIKRLNLVVHMVQSGQTDSDLPQSQSESDGEIQDMFYRYSALIRIS